MKNSLTQSGFTLVEMIVSLALFSIVITIAVGSLLVIVASNEQLQDEQSVMTNLSFALDSMTREIRTGTDYYCDAQNSSNAGPSGKKIFRNGSTLDDDPVQDCYDGNIGGRVFNGISFVEGGNSVSGSASRIVYFFDSSTGKIFRRISGFDAEPVVSSGIFITNAEFYVTGTEVLTTGDTIQPTVTIFIEARESNNPASKTYQIQTTVTQRTLDI